MKNSQTKVVVTGLGVVSTLGQDIDTFWENLNAGVCGLKHQSILDEKETPFRMGGYIGELEEKKANGFSTLDRTTQLAIKAATQAIEHSHLFEIDHFEELTTAVVMGTTCGSNDVIETDSFEENWHNEKIGDCPVHSFENYKHEAAANEISKKFGFEGPSYVVGTACASGNHAIGEAVELIRSGQANYVICGGADAFTLLPILGFYSMKALSNSQCTPFQKDREGMILGEGSAAFVLESYGSAIKRGIPILAEVESWALNCDAKNFAAPIESGERCKELIRSCIDDVNLEPENIDYINLHGTGTQVNDLMEARGISSLYGESVKKIMVSSTKGVIGHTLGAAGALDGLTSVLAIMKDCIPPNTPVEQKDEGVELNLVTESTPKLVNRVLSLSFAFGGCNVATLFSKA